MKIKVDIQEILQEYDIGSATGSEYDTDANRGKSSDPLGIRSVIDTYKSGGIQSLRSATVDNPEAEARERKARELLEKDWEDLRAKSKQERLTAANQALNYLETSVNEKGKIISKNAIALSLLLLEDNNIKTLSFTSDDVNKYSSTVNRIVTKKVDSIRLLLGLDYFVAGADSIAVLIAGLKEGWKLGYLERLARRFAPSLSPLFKPAEKVKLGLLRSIVSSPVALVLGVSVGAVAWWQSLLQDDIEKSDIEIVLFDLRPMFKAYRPTNKQQLAAAIAEQESDIFRIQDYDIDAEKFFDSIGNAVNTMTSTALVAPYIAARHLENALKIYEKYRGRKKGPSTLYKAFNNYATEKAMELPKYFRSKDVVYILDQIRRFARSRWQRALPKDTRKMLAVDLIDSSYYNMDQAAKMLLAGFGFIDRSKYVKSDGSLKPDVAKFKKISARRARARSLQPPKKEQPIKKEHRGHKMKFKIKIDSVINEVQALPVIGESTNPYKIASKAIDWMKNLDIRAKNLWVQITRNVDPAVSRIVRFELQPGFSLQLRLAGDLLDDLTLKLAFKDLLKDVYRLDGGILAAQLNTRINKAQKALFEQEAAGTGLTQLVFPIDQAGTELVILISNRGIEGIAGSGIPGIDNVNTVLKNVKSRIVKDMQDARGLGGAKIAGRVAVTRGSLADPYDSFDDLISNYTLGSAGDAAGAALKGAAKGAYDATVRLSIRYADAVDDAGAPLKWPLTRIEKTFGDVSPEDFVYYRVSEDSDDLGVAFVVDGRIKSSEQAFAGDQDAIKNIMVNPRGKATELQTVANRTVQALPKFFSGRGKLAWGATQVRDFFYGGGRWLRSVYVPTSIMGVPLSGIAAIATQILLPVGTILFARSPLGLAIEGAIASLILMTGTVRKSKMMFIAQIYWAFNALNALVQIVVEGWLMTARLGNNSNLRAVKRDVAKTKYEDAVNNPGKFSEKQTEARKKVFLAMHEQWLRSISDFFDHRGEAPVLRRDGPRDNPLDPDGPIEQEYQEALVRIEDLGEALQARADALKGFNEFLGGDFFPAYYDAVTDGLLTDVLVKGVNLLPGGEKGSAAIIGFIPTDIEGYAKPLAFDISKDIANATAYAYAQVTSDFGEAEEGVVEEIQKALDALEEAGQNPGLGGGGGGQSGGSDDGNQPDEEAKIDPEEMEDYTNQFSPDAGSQQGAPDAGPQSLTKDTGSQQGTPDAGPQSLAKDTGRDGFRRSDYSLDDHKKNLGSILENFLGGAIIKNIKLKPKSKVRFGDKK